MRLRITRLVAVIASVGAAGVAAACDHDTALPEDTGTTVPDAGADASADGARRAFDAADDDDTGAPAPTGPLLLSQTGLYTDIDARIVSPDLIAFAPRYEFWADGAKKTRWLYLPPGTKIDTSSLDGFTFPVGTKVFKEFRYGSTLVETRLLMKVRAGFGNSSWFQMAYVWKSDATDAVATPLGVDNALGTMHRVPSQIDCANCHGGVTDVLIGVSALQLSDPSHNALAALGAAGQLTTPVPASIEVPGSGVVKDALAYLHANCGHCHNADAPRVSTQSKLRLQLLVAQTTPEMTGAYTTTVGTVMKHAVPPDNVMDIVVKGDPDHSGLWLRMDRRDAFGMPPTGTQIVDEAGVATVRSWLLSWQ